jgi:cellulose synthase/poly-beta-1,6-N-acetylglucosamine synthase-like glycosyltransferase
VIPAHNEQSVIKECVTALMRNNGNVIKKVYVVVNNCSDKTGDICDYLEKKFSKVKVINLNNKNPSKIKSVLKALQFIKDGYFVILDADTILKRDAIKKIYSLVLSQKADMGTGIIDPYPRKGLQYNIISWDRIFRQRFLQITKSKFNMSNFPGCLAVVKTKKYKEDARNNLLEDYGLTLKNIRDGGRIVFVQSIVAYEKERETFSKLFFQRVRWTVGNVKMTKEFIKTFKKISFPKKLVLLSYPLFWYFLNYYMTFLLILSLANPNYLLNYLLLFLAIFLILIISKKNFNDLKTKDLFIAPLFIIIFPVIISLALIYALLKLELNNRVETKIFSQQKYFQR